MKEEPAWKGLVKLFGKTIAAAPPAEPGNAGGGAGGGAEGIGKAGAIGEVEKLAASGEAAPPAKKQGKMLPCPRCDSKDTKFCYYNNYNVNQPRHFCRSCQRYWTAGGAMRDVPVGAGRRKTKHPAAPAAVAPPALLRFGSDDPLYDWTNPPAAAAVYPAAAPPAIWGKRSRDDDPSCQLWMPKAQRSRDGGPPDTHFSSFALVN
ncbi:uncharacterized protein LOC144710854 [Wolffia australiana]